MRRGAMAALRTADADKDTPERASCKQAICQQPSCASAASADRGYENIYRIAAFGSKLHDVCHTDRPSASIGHGFAMPARCRKACRSGADKLVGAAVAAHAAIRTGCIAVI